MKTQYAIVLALAVPTLSIGIFEIAERKRHDAEIAELQRRIDLLKTRDVTSFPFSENVSAALGRSLVASMIPNAPVAHVADAPSVGGGGAATSAPAVPQPPEIRDNLEIAFDNNRSAPNDWGGQPRSVALDRLNAVLPQGSSLTSFECHAEMCRIETSHPNMSQYMRFARSAFMDRSTQIWNGPVYLTRLNESAPPGEAPVMVAYIAQPGHRLPQQ